MKKLHLHRLIVCQAIIACFLTALAANSVAQGFPNVTQGTPGTLIKGPIAEEMGRLAIIDTLGGYVITIPEIPGSEASDDLIARAWDLSDPNNPRVVATLGQTRHGFDAHGTIKRGNQVYLGANRAVELDDSGNLQVVPWAGATSEWNRSGMMAPWGANLWWSYGTVEGNAVIELDGVTTASWDHLGLTGVIGMPLFMGNLLFYASDQSLTGVAAYDVSDPSNPVLLDVLNAPAEDGGIGGYWMEIHGHYIVFARRNNPIWSGDRRPFAGIQAVDFSDPSNLRLHCSIAYPTETYHAGHTADVRSADPMYVGFQDEYVFAERFKVNIETCTTELILPRQEEVETSQYSRPVGNLLITGGYPTPNPGIDGMGIWVHQSAPDTRSPYVAYHIPKNNQTNYPIMAPISVHIPETLQSQTIVTTEISGLGPETLTLTEVGGDPVRIDYILSHTGLLTIDPIDYLTPDTTYELRLSSGILDAVGNPLEAYSFRFSTGDTIASADAVVAVDPPVIASASVSPLGLVDVGESVTVSAIATHSANEAIEYQFERQGQVGPWTTANSETFQFSQAGTYPISVRSRNSGGQSALVIKQITVVDTEQTALAGNYSSQLHCSVGDNRVWLVNPDNDSIGVINTDSLTLVNEFGGVDKPRSVAVDASGNLWVTSSAADRIDVFNSQGSRVRQISTGYGSMPYGIVMSPNGQVAYVSLYGSGELVRFNTGSFVQTGTITLDATVSALALTPDGSRLLATRFISAENWGEVWDINTGAFSLTRTLRLDKHLVDDDINEGRGVPNYLSSIIINSDGTRAYLVGKKDNVDRGLLNGLGLDLDDDNSVRAMAMTLDLQNNIELRDQRVDFDNTDSPSALALSLDGTKLFVAMQGINQVFAINVNDNQQLDGIASQLSVGHAPQGVCVDYGVNRLFAKNFTDRSVSAVDISASLINPAVSTIATVSNEALAADVVDGQRIFYDAANGLLEGTEPRGVMSAEGYISCASCHVDGGHDGRTYDFTGRGEGLRNNISLKGRSGTRFGNVHWTANFDEIQDFEHDIRNAFRGRGFMTDADFSNAAPLGVPKAGASTDLDKLAAYVSSLGESSLPRSPHRQASGAMTSAAQNGEILFQQNGCASCHSGEGFSDGLAHDVGTLRSYSGNRLGVANTLGLKTPPLLSLFDSAPYLHDGSAKTVADVFSSVGGEVFQAELLAGNYAPVSQLSDTYSYLRDGAGVRLRLESTTGDYLAISGVDGGSGGPALVRLRYGSVAVGGAISVWRVGSGDGTDGRIEFEQLPQVDGQDVAFTESSAVEIDLLPGTNNTLYLWVNRMDAFGSDVIIDDITVSNSDDIAAASAHTVVRSLATAERNDLIEYLLQIDQYNDGSSAPGSAPSTNNGASNSGSDASQGDDAVDAVVEVAVGSLGHGLLLLMLVLGLLRRGLATSSRTRPVCKSING
ncbi:MAG: Ig-like domain-containing protein [Cellvibrionaceae bacterium]|nr:Ig-like domain-containing protein [Cellvibrionaceae bacterium]